MKNCKNCNADGLPDALHFCPHCGADLDAQTATADATPDLNANVAASMTEASNADTTPPVADNQPQPPNGQRADKAAKAKARRAKKRKAYFKLGLLLVGALAAVAVTVAVLVNLGRRPRNGPLVYVRDGAVYTVGADGKNETMIRAATLADGRTAVAFAAKKPDRFVFVPETADDQLTGLAYVDLKNSNQIQMQLESAAIADFGISADGKAVWYATVDGGLYLHDLRTKQVIATEAVDYLFSDDLARCAYRTAAGELYYTATGDGAQPVKLSSEALSIELFKGNCLAYTRTTETDAELVLYGTKNGTETVYPAGYIAAQFADDNSFYFLVPDGGTMPGIKDLHEKEDSMWPVREGAKSEYGYPAGEWYYWYSFYESQERTEVRGDISGMTREEYLLYSARMAVRQQLTAVSDETATLYFFNGKSASVVTTAVIEVSVPGGALTADTPLLCARQNGRANPGDVDNLAEPFVGKVKAIEYAPAADEAATRIEVTYLGDDPDGTAMELAAQVQALAHEWTEYVTVSKANMTATGLTGTELAADLGGEDYAALAAHSGESIYLRQLGYQGHAGNLFEKPAKKGGAVTQLTTDVTTVLSLDWGVLSAAPEDGDPTTLTLFANGETVDSRVEASSIVAAPHEAAVWYLKDFDGVTGDLYRWQDGKAVLLCADTARFSVLADGRALVLRGYSLKTGTGELCLADARKGATVLATEVDGLLTPNDGQYIVFEA